MIGLGRWVLAGVAALGAGAVAALASRRAPGQGIHGGGSGDAPDVPPAGSSEDPQAALEAARQRLRQRADEVRAQLERHPD